MNPFPNQTAAIFGPTAGIARNMQWDVSPQGAIVLGAVPLASGGGDLNGTAAQSILFGHAGTAAQRIAVPRAVAGNYTGII